MTTVPRGGMPQTSRAEGRPRLAAPVPWLRGAATGYRRQMTSSTEIITRYLYEAKAMESSLQAVLAGQLATTPGGSYRTRLERHLDETRRHERLVTERLEQLGAGPGAISKGIELAENVVGRTIAVGRLPLDLLRGVSGEEEVLKNARHACATEALEIATYRALEQIAVEAGDPQTAEIAREIRLQEEQMLRDVVDDIVPELATEVVDAEVTGYGTYEARTDAAGTPDARAAVPRRSGEPWPGYDELTVAAVERRLADLGDGERAAVGAYERRHKNRRGVIAASERKLAPSS